MSKTSVLSPQSCSSSPQSGVASLPACKHWFAIHVRSRHEKHVRAEFLGEGIECFLPLVDRLRQWKDRRKMVEFPLFPGYLFVNLVPGLEEFHRVVKTRGVVRILGGERGNPDPVPTVQVESIQRLLEQKHALDPYPYLQVGQKVRVRSGPLLGVEGILMEKHNRRRLVISIDLLQQAVSTTIDAHLVEPV